AIATLGLLLTYTSSRVFTVAHGAIAFFIAITFHELAVGYGWNKIVAGVFSVFVIAPALGFFLWLVLFRRLTNAPPTVRLVSTIGLWVAIPPIARVLYGSSEVFDQTGIGWSPTHHYKLFGVAVDSNLMIVLIASLAIAIVITLIMRFTPFGLSVRATVDSTAAAGIAGINTTVVSAGTWMIGTCLAGVAGVLLAPLRGYTEFQFTFLLLAAFAACVVARMSSLVLGVAGAVLIGLLQNIVQSSQASDFLTTFIPKDSIILTALQPSIPFIVMIVFLLAYSGFGKEKFVTDRRAGPTTAVEPVDDSRPLVVRLVPVFVAAALILLAPTFLSGLWLAVVAKGLALAIAFLSAPIATGEGGMISLCQITFAGIAGAITAQLATNQGVPVLLAVLLAALIVVPIGLLVALPSLRLGGLYLALLTIGFAELVQNMYFKQQSINNFDSGVVVPRPVVGSINFTSDTSFYYLLAAFFLVCAILVWNLQRSTTGLRLAATRSSEEAASTLGIRIINSKLLAFGFSAFLAGLGGGLYVTYAGRATPSQSFDALIGIVWLAVVVTWGVRSPVGALMAGLSFVVLPVLFSQHLSGDWLEVPTMLFGLGAIGLAREPRGAIYQIAEGRQKKRARRAAKALVAAEAASRVQPVAEAPV
ncbi:MAG: ABC-type branched-chain amino acid transport system, permease component, partial [Actinomycetia bacterium]|nr:ABC-type branched-chain amino acid transport system, permease component [Actinomycetes bacterium]